MRAVILGLLLAITLSGACRLRELEGRLASSCFDARHFCVVLPAAECPSVLRSDIGSTGTYSTLYWLNTTRYPHFTEYFADLAVATPPLALSRSLSQLFAERLFAAVDSAPLSFPLIALHPKWKVFFTSVVDEDGDLTRVRRSIARECKIRQQHSLDAPTPASVWHSLWLAVRRMYVRYVFERDDAGSRFSSLDMLGDKETLYAYAFPPATNRAARGQPGNPFFSLPWSKMDAKAWLWAYSRQIFTRLLVLTVRYTRVMVDLMGAALLAVLAYTALLIVWYTRQRGFCAGLLLFLLYLYCVLYVVALALIYDVLNFTLIPHALNSDMRRTSSGGGGLAAAARQEKSLLGELYGLMTFLAFMSYILSTMHKERTRQRRVQKRRRAEAEGNLDTDVDENNNADDDGGHSSLMANLRSFGQSGESAVDQLSQLGRQMQELQSERALEALRWAEDDDETDVSEGGYDDENGENKNEPERK